MTLKIADLWDGLANEDRKAKEERAEAMTYKSRLAPALMVTPNDWDQLAPTVHGCVDDDVQALALDMVTELS